MAKQVKELTEQEKLEKNILNTLAELGGKAVGEKDISFGEKFSAPRQFENDIPAIIKFWVDYQDSQQEPTRFSKKFPYKPWDGAVAVMRSFERAFGTQARARATMTFFGPEPPEMIDVPISPTQTMAVAWGEFSIPIFRGTLHVGSYIEEETQQTLFQCTIDTAKKNEGPVMGLWKLIEDELRTNSIYRGRAFDGSDMPRFIDLSGFHEDKVIYNQVTLHQMNANIWVPILYPDMLDEIGVEKKRAVLLQGPYGTGKTLGAMSTAMKCERKQRTFIMCNPKDNNVFEVLETAALYQPACVFVEDIDVLTSQGNDRAVQEYLDKFDGLRAKGKDIIGVFTTNNVERIHKGMLRPGRLDAVIALTNHDREATEKMIKSLFRPDMLGEIDFDKVYEAMTDFTPAFVKETCEKVKLYSIARSGNGPRNKYETLDFLAAAEEMRTHHNLHIGAKEGIKRDSLETQLMQVVAEAMDKTKILRRGDNFARLDTGTSEGRK